MPTNIAESGEQLNEQVEECLESLKDQKFFEILRSTVQDPGTFFDPEKGIVEENDESMAKDVLDLYVDQINAGDPLAIKNLDFRPVRVMYAQALEPDSFSRKVLEAYYMIDATTTWAEASDNIVTQQAHKQENFPTVNDTDRVVAALTKAGPQEQ